MTYRAGEGRPMRYMEGKPQRADDAAEWARWVRDRVVEWLRSEPGYACRRTFLDWSRTQYPRVSSRDIKAYPHGGWTRLLEEAKAAAGGVAVDYEEEVEGTTIDVVHPPSEIDINELLARRQAEYDRKRKHEELRHLIPVHVSDDRPIGLLFFGDPHLDDSGTDIATIERHARLVRDTPGLWGANLGDSTNNWVGRLAALYAQQSTTGDEAWALVEWFVQLVRDWLFMIGGNHDLWSGHGDPIHWIARQHETLYQSSEVRVGLRFPNGREVRINARHDFKGHSMYNAAHGPMKAAMIGFHDHLLISGHKHVSGYGVIKDPATGTISHCVQVASYKIFDRYAREHGFRDQHVSPAVLAVIDPGAEREVGLVDVYHDIERGVRVLEMLRGGYGDRG